jgi:hypothetical protein
MGKIGNKGNTQGTGHKFSEGNQSALKHGGEAAVHAISKNKPFTGLAAAEQERVESQLSLVGSLGVERDLMTRLVTATNLYWDAIQKAAQEGDLEALDRYIQRFGWLATSSLRALKQVSDHEKEGGNTPIDAQIILDSYRKEGEKDAENNE